MASCCFPDIYEWIKNLPPHPQWNTNSMSLRICSSNFSSQPSLTLSINKNHLSPTLSIIADFNLPISLWTSRPFKLNSNSSRLSDTDAFPNLLINFIEDVFQYGTNKSNSSVRVPKLLPHLANNIKEMLNFSFLTLSFLVCIYEAPRDLRSGCLVTLKNHLTNPKSREASKLLMKYIGSNLEEQWMRTVNLAITSWIVEKQANAQHPLKIPSPLFSYGVSTSDLWKVQSYCPVISMDMVNSNNSPDERLQFSLNYHQLEGVIQFNYKATVQEKWIDLMVNIDNIRFDVIQLVSDKLLAERGAGPGEKHFPSRISVQLTPIIQSNVLSVSVSKSSENPVREIGYETGIEGSFEPPTSLSLTIQAGESMTMSLKPWTFEESVHGCSANLNWFLHDTVEGKEVISSKPSKIAMIQPKSWFKHRYSKAYRPFTRQGGVVFAGDKYGEPVWWKLCKGAIGKTLEWEIKGRIWLTYWPNKYRTFYNETRRLEFREILHVNIP